ncbi:MAG: HAD family hydrolase, partial [Phycisphaeraceae bacterium]
MKPAVFLDRDNTLIHNDGDLGDPALVRLIQGAGSAIASLCGLGYKIVVITNQGGVARGKYTEDDVRQVHDRLHELVVQAANGARIDAFYYCPYHPDGSVHRYKQEHPTRKPQPGMLLQAAEQMQLDLSQSWTIGDQLRDIEA